MIIINSMHNVPIRINNERLWHIYNRHPEMCGCKEQIVEAISEPDFIQEGDFGVLLAIKRIELEEPSKYIVAVYKETNKEDGFLITAYFTRQYAKWRNILWKR